MSDRSFRIPTRTARAGKEGWAPREGGEAYPNLIRTMKTGQPIMFRLLNDPMVITNSPDREVADSDFVYYRQVKAWDGLLGGLKMKPGLFEFPVFDMIYFEDGTRTSAPRGTDLLFDSVLPSERDLQKKFNRAPGQDVFCFNAIYLDGKFAGKDDYQPVPGQHVLIQLTGQKAEQFLEQMEIKAEEFEDFDPTLGAWVINLTGEPPNTNLTLTRKTKGLDDSLMSVQAEPINVMQYLSEVRAAAEEHWEAQKVAVHGAGDEGPGDEDEVVDAFESATQTVDYSVMSSARLKKMLSDANVEIPNRATTAQLIELAKSNL
jgi:hypothetical protein